MNLLKQIKDIYNLSKGFSYCRGKIEIREKRADKEIIQKIQKRKEKIGSADKSAEQSNTKCAHDAVAETLGVNSKQLADATGLAASTKGATIDDIKKLYQNIGIQVEAYNVDYAVKQLEEVKSDRAIICFKNGKDMGHAVAAVLENDKLMIKENGQEISLKQYKEKYNYTDVKVIVPKKVNSVSLNDIQNQIIKNQIDKVTHNVEYVGSDNFDKCYGQKPSSCGKFVSKKDEIIENNNKLLKNKVDGILKTKEKEEKFKVDNTATPTDQDKKNIIGKLKSNQPLPTTHTDQNFDGQGKFRCDHASDKYSFEIQKNGQKGQTTIAVVHYPKGLFEVLQSPEQIKKAHKIIAESLKSSLDASKRITLGGKVFEDLLSTEISSCDNQNKKHQGDITKTFLRATEMDYWFDYNEIGLESLLKLRLQSAFSNSNILESVKVVEPIIFDVSIDTSYKYQLASLAEKIHDVYANQHYLENILIPILIPQSDIMYHWVGIAVKKEGSNLKFIYIDSENEPIIQTVEEGLSKYLHTLNYNYSISFKQVTVEQQKYNNCGPELIENFIWYLTGNRVSQEAAVLLHSKLLENSLLDNFMQPFASDALNSQEALMGVLEETL